MCSNDEAKKLAEMLDRLCADGSAHINVSALGGGDDITEKTMNSTECCTGNMACSVPTLHRGIDDDEEDK
ncbi:MAG: hypothetical protein J6A16_11620 [Oscillospiraceae bacterium]|nr:hypothetical protein [Oscillospiraceae bacterium]